MVRDDIRQQRRPMLRFFACEEDLSHEPPDALLPDAVTSGAKPSFPREATQVLHLDAKSTFD
jgi:hypothetical protein